MKWMVAVLLVFVAPSLFAQADSSSVVQDSTALPEPLIPSGMTAASVDTVHKFTPTKSPGLAMLFSALIPGTGQLYNESYWKIPVVLGFGVWFGSQWLHNNRLYHDYRDQYSASLTDSIPGENGRFLQLREFYRDRRDEFSWYLLILYLVNVADAYVDASLYDFNVGDDLSIRLRPEGWTWVTLRVTF